MSARLLSALVRGLEARAEIEARLRREEAARAVERTIARLRGEWLRAVKDPLARYYNAKAGRPDYAMEPHSPVAVLARDAYVERRLREIVGAR